MEPPMRDDWGLAPQPSRRKLYIIGGVVAVVLIIISAVLANWLTRSPKPLPVTVPPIKKPIVSQVSTETPEIKTEVLLSGRQNIWEMAFLPGKEMLFTERGGAFSMFKDNKVQTVATFPDVRAVGEGGLTGFALDGAFSQTRNIFFCYNSTAGDIRVVRWRLKEDLSGLEKRLDVVTGIPANPSGRHSGCRMAFGPDGYLWIGTGDSAQNLTPQSPQDPKSLGGKILRVNANGKPAPDNPVNGFDSRVYSYGHRNTQGIAFFPASRLGVLGVSVEHGSDVDDEVNLLKPGNFGWAPPDGPYNEVGVPMTDKQRFPSAIDAIWSSGSPTQAPSGATILHGSQWKGWDGAVAIAMLKSQHLKILRLNDQLQVTREERKLEGEYERLRAAVEGPDGNLYISTANEVNDKILRVTPQ